MALKLSVSSKAYGRTEIQPGAGKAKVWDIRIKDKSNATLAIVFIVYSSGNLPIQLSNNNAVTTYEAKLTLLK
jgi:hypothetical protein